MKKSTPSARKSLVSVIILNWNRPNDTLECIESVKKQTYKNIEIIVVDNGSKDNSKEILRNVSGITLIENEFNRGFTGGHIDGLAGASGEFIFVLNNDAVVDKDYVTNAYNILSGDAKIAVVGGRSYHWKNGSEMFDTNNPFYAFQTINRFSMEGIFAQHDAGYDHEVNWVSGSAMVIRRKALKKTGYFFDPLFAYYEESDLFARIQAADFTIVYSPALKIWHKDGASSSSYFQFNQLFKNRFVFGMRHLSSKDLARFIKSYGKTTLRGSYHHLTKKSGTPDEKVMNHALYGALQHSVTTWPKWALTRKSVLQRDSHGHTLSDRLKIEQTGISFVCDVSKDISKLTELSEFIRMSAYKHYNSEIIVVCESKDIQSLRKLIATKDLPHTNIKLVANTRQTQTNPLNLGWLSASKDYIWFISPSYQPTIDKINTACVRIDSYEYSAYLESSSLKKDKNVTMSQDACFSRSILSLYGGIDSPQLQQSLAHLAYFASMIPGARVHTDINKSVKKQITISAEVIAKIRLIISGYVDQKHTSTPYANALKKYYRLYQLHNMVSWLFIGQIPTRHKLARIRNTTLATLTLKRKELALELKHISNEVIKVKHSGFNKDERDKDLLTIANRALKNDNWKATPVFIICRDRVTPLRELLSWFKKKGMTNIILIDNDSIYPELVTFLDTTDYQVIKTGKNVGHTVVWKEGIAKTLFPNQYYIVTDPDVIPDTKTPKDAIVHFYELHKKYIDYQKVGFGLQINDLPDHYKLKEHVIAWEKQFWTNELEPNVYEASLDTTFALYKPYTDYYTLHPSIRTGTPYTARHLPWYVDSELIDEEEAFYRMHANQDITSWNTDEILERYKVELSKQ